MSMAFGWSMNTSYLVQRRDEDNISGKKLFIVGHPHAQLTTEGGCRRTARVRSADRNRVRNSRSPPRLPRRKLLQCPLRFLLKAPVTIATLLSSRFMMGSFVLRGLPPPNGGVFRSGDRVSPPIVT
jgi:hypothetical protein